MMIELNNVSKHYVSSGSVIKALSNITMSVGKGEIVGVIGKSGAGKSTLIRCVNLLERPTSGEVKVSGEDLTQLSAVKLRQARKKIGMVFQHFNLLTTKTVYQNIAFPLVLLGKSKQEIADTVCPLVEMMELKGREHAYPGQLSGGQKQRVAIARALATKPEVLLCDEMTSSLDPETTTAILALVKKINHELGLSILLITHEMDVIKRIADKVIVLENSEIIESGSVIDVFKAPKASITRKLTQSTLHVTVPKLLAARMVATPLNGGVALLRITFIGGSVTEPVMTELVERFELKPNILQASLEMLQMQTFGVMLVAMSYKEGIMDQAIAHMQQRGLIVEVVGYVTTLD